MDNSENLATWGTQNEDKHNKITKQYALDTTLRKQTQVTLIRHDPSSLLSLRHVYIITRLSIVQN
jgi:hypothetical protein